ncbi:MAG: hypothetical protein HOH33_09180 [Verrucomicrobia bacterium]|nr:hypothetical protein [Verrucomicrobiota bacterium]
MNNIKSRLHLMTVFTGMLWYVLLNPNLKAEPVDAAWISAASGSWTEVFRWNTFGFLPFPNNDDIDDYNVLIALDASPSILLDTKIDLLHLELAAGFIQGSHSLTTEQGFLWRGGGFIGGNGNLIAPLNIIMTSGTKTLRGFSVINHQEATWQSGDVRSGTSGIFQNLEGAVFRNTFDGRWLSDGSRPHGQFSNIGTFFKQESTDTTLMDASFMNSGQVFIQTGKMEFAGPTTNAGNIEANADTALEFSHEFNGTPDSSILSLNEVNFSSQLNIAQIRGTYSVANATTLSGKETIFHPETDLIDLGHTLSVRKGKAYFNSEETIAPQDLLLTEKGQILGNDLITVQNHFLWSNGTGIGGEGNFFNVSLTEMPLNEPTRDPRILGNRAFINFGKMLWTGGDLVMFEQAAIVNQLTGTLSIQGNVRATAFTPKAYPKILNEGLLEFKSPANNVHLEWNVQSKGRIVLPEGRVTIQGGLQVNGGRLTSNNSVLTTPELTIQRGVLAGKLTVNGSIKSSGKLNLQTPVTKISVSDSFEFEQTNECHITIGNPEIGNGFPSIHANNLLVVKGDLVVSFAEDWQPRHGQRVPILKSDLLLGEFRNVFPLRVNDSFSIFPYYDKNQMSLIVFQDGGVEIPGLSAFDAGDVILLTWPRAFSEYRVQFKSSFADEEWTTHRRTFVNFTTFPKDEPLMLFRLVEP